MTYAELVSKVIGFINFLIPVLFAGVFLVIVWKIIDIWIIHGDSSEDLVKGGRFALTAVLVLVVTVSLWGILALLRNSLFG